MRGRTDDRSNCQWRPRNLSGFAVARASRSSVLARRCRRPMLPPLPDHRMTRALTEASERGVRVVVLLPGAIDNNIVRHASRSKFGPLLEAGVEIYEYQAGLLHAKTMTVDGIWATIGSTNLDTRSFALNDEVNAVVYHNEVVGRLEQVFADDLTRSEEHTSELQ